jgi:hypothetical protein
MRPLNFIWYKFGLALHHIVNPVLMGLIYFGAVVPMGLIMQLKGRDALRMKNAPQRTAIGYEASSSPGPTRFISSSKTISAFQAKSIRCHSL